MEKEPEGAGKGKKLGFWGLGILLLTIFILSLAGHLHQERLLEQAKAEYDEAGEALYRAYQEGTESKEDLERLSAAHGRYWALQREQTGRGSSAVISTEYMWLSGIALFLWLLTLIGRGILRAARWSADREERQGLEREPWEDGKGCP